MQMSLHMLTNDKAYLLGGYNENRVCQTGFLNMQTRPFLTAKLWGIGGGGG